MRTMVALMLTAALALTNCGDDDNGPTSPAGDGSVTLKLTDAPGNLAHAWVELSQIYLLGEGEDGAEVVLMHGPSGLIDLLDLAGATADLVRDVPVPAGHYSQLRLVVEAAIIETEDGRVFATVGAEHPDGTTVTDHLQCPSCSQSGLKIKLPGGSIEIQKEARILVIDFDVRESFGHEAGKSGKWIMHPVIHATELVSSGAIAGSIALAPGVTIPDCGGTPRSLSIFVPQAEDDEGMIHSSNYQPGDRYEIKYLAPGEYIMGYSSTVEFYSEALRFSATPSGEPVTVTAGGSVSVDYTITAASCMDLDHAASEGVTMQLTATVETVDDRAGLLPGDIQPGDTITGTYTYDPTIEDSNSAETVGDYRHNSPPYGIFLEIQGHEFKTDLSNVDFLMELVNDHGTSPKDNYLLRSYNNAQLSPDVSVEHISWQLDDSGADALTSTELTTEPPVLSDWTSTFGISISGYQTDNEGNTFLIRGHVSEVSRVP